MATNNSEYQLVRPAATYKKVYNDIHEQAEILYEVCCPDWADLLGLQRMALTSLMSILGSDLLALQRMALTSLMSILGCNYNYRVSHAQ